MSTTNSTGIKIELTIDEARVVAGILFHEHIEARPGSGEWALQIATKIEQAIIAAEIKLIDDMLKKD